MESWEKIPHIGIPPLCIWKSLRDVSVMGDGVSLSSSGALCWCWVEGGRELKGQDAGNPDDRRGKRERGGEGGAWGQGMSALSPIAE